MDYVWLSFRISWLLSNMFEIVSNVTQLAVPTASLAMAWSWLSSILYFGLEIALLTLMYLIQLLKQRTPREWKAKSMAIAGWKNWAWLIQSMYALRDSCWQPVSAIVKTKHFYCSFISEEERWEAKVLTLTWQFQIVSLDLVSFGDFLWKWF